MLAALLDIGEITAAVDLVVRANVRLTFEPDLTLGVRAIMTHLDEPASGERFTIPDVPLSLREMK